MAAGTIQKPGSKFGPCKKACEHIDCAASRNIAKAACVYCSKPIGYVTAYYREAWVESEERYNFSHAVCGEEAAEAAR